MLARKIEKLDNILKELKSFVVAFSGGVDSTFLLYRATRIEKIRYIALTVKTMYIPDREIEEASQFCRNNKIKHKILEITSPDLLRDNPIERCYLCKKIIFGNIADFAAGNNYDYIVEGTNHDDKGDFRPGIKALEEMGIISPLMQAGLTKEEIRIASKIDGLPTWDKPAYACLLTRIPYNTVVYEKDLRMIEEAEQFFFSIGFYGTRVRLHGEVARIECMPDYLGKFVNNPERQQIIDNLKKIGFRFISLDLEGYRTGSMNPDNNRYDKEGTREAS